MEASTLERIARDTADKWYGPTENGNLKDELATAILATLTTATADLRREVEHLKDCKGTCGLECLNCAQDSARQGLVYYKEAKAENDRLRKALITIREIHKAGISDEWFISDDALKPAQ